MSHELKLEDFGYDEFFDTHRDADGMPVARVVAQHKGVYRVKNTAGEYMAKITGKHMFDASSREDYPAVGDWVVITDAQGQRAVIQRVLPRKTVIKRKRSGKRATQIIATNIDVAFVIESMDRDYNLNRIERYLAIVTDDSITPAIIFNKTDLITKDQLHSRIIEIQNRFGDIDLIGTSTLTNEGMEVLAAYIEKGKTYCFLGSSGVGKSSLINKLMATDRIKTSQISERSDRGRHTTTHREMFFLENGGIVIDNPGMREVAMTEATDGINSLFDEITALAQQCKYVNCTHIHEPGCAVLAAIQSGQMNHEQYSNYINLKKEAEHFEMTQLEKRKKEGQFGKSIKKAKKQIKRYGHKDY